MADDINTNVNVNVTETGAQSAVAAFKAMQAAQEDVAASAAKATAALGTLNAAAVSLGTAGQQVAQGAREMSAAHRAMAADFDYARFAGQKLITVFDELSRGQRGALMSTLGASFRQLGGGIQELFLPLLAIGGAVTVIEHLASSFGDLAIKNQNAAAAAGMSVQEYSQLSRTMQLVDGDAQKAERTFGILGESIERAINQPGSRSQGAFAQILGPGWQEQLQTMLENPLTALDTLRQRFSELPPTLERTELFRAALGRGFESMISILRLNDAEWARFNQMARETGSVMSDELAKKLAETGVAAHKLTEDFQGLGQAIAARAENHAFLDFLDAMVRKLTANLDVIAPLVSSLSLLHNAVDGVKDIVSGTVGGVKDIVSPIAEPFATAKIPPVNTTGVPFPTQQNNVRGAVNTPLTFRDASGKYVRATISNGQMNILPDQYGALSSGQYDPSGMQRELQNRIKEIEDEKIVRLAANKERMAEASGDTAQERSVEAQRVAIVEEYAKREADIRQQYAEKAAKFNDPNEANKLADSARQQAAALDARAEQINKNKQFNAQDYADYKAAIELKIQEDRQFPQKVGADYDEWLGKIKSVYSQDQKEFDRVQKAKVAAIQSATRESLSQQMGVAETVSRVDQSGIGILRARLQAQVDEHRLTTSQILAIEERATDEVAQKEEKLYEAVANRADATTEVKIRAYEKIMEVAERAAEREAEASKRISDQMKKDADQAAKIWTQSFDTIGSALEKFFTEGLTGGTTLRQAFAQLARSLISDFTKTGFGLVSQSLAKAIQPNVEEGKGLGSVLGGTISKLFGGGGTRQQDQLSTLQESAKLSADQLNKAAAAQEKLNELLGQTNDALSSLVHGGGTMPNQYHWGGVAHFAQGGLASDEVPAILHVGERVLNPMETDAYHTMFPGGILNNKTQRFLFGGVAQTISTPAVTVPPRVTQSGGITTENRGSYTPPLSYVNPQENIGQLIAVLGGTIAAVVALTAVINAFKSDTTSGSSSSSSTVSTSSNNVVSSFSQVASAAAKVDPALSGVASAASTASTGLSLIKSVTGLVSGAGSGIGGIFGAIGSFLGLQHGGIIPSAAGGMILPRFDNGGILSMLHANEMVLPAHISQFVQNAAMGTSGGGGGDSGDVHVHVHAIDQRSGAQWLMNNKDHLARALYSARRTSRYAFQG